MIKLIAHKWIKMLCCNQKTNEKQKQYESN